MIPQISKSVNGVKRDLSWAYFHLDIEVLACKKYLFLCTSSVCIMEVGNYKIKVATFSLWVVLKMNVQKKQIKHEWLNHMNYSTEFNWLHLQFIPIADLKVLCHV
jgi:hypothetical protein